MGNPAWGVTWRVLLVCAMIDLPFWAYFHFVKGVSLWEGLAQMRSEVQAKINPPKATEEIRFKMADAQQGQPKPKPTWNTKYDSQLEKQNIENDPIKSAELALLEEKKKKHIEEVNEMVAAEMGRRTKKSSEPIYSWRNEDGYRGYSNVGFPKNGKYSDPRIEFQ